MIYGKSNVKPQKNSLDLVKLEGEPTLIVSSKLQSQINYLHSKVGRDEWCGPLIYEILQGDINDPENLVIQCNGIYLMDIGSSAYTEYEMTDMDAVEMMNQYPEMETGDVRTGLIHTHHSMKASFSGTDNDELKDNIRNYNAYLSLIVSFDGNYAARIAFISEVVTENKKRIRFNSVNDESYEINESEEDTKEVVAYYDCDINIESEVEDAFRDRYDIIHKRKEESKKKVSTNKYYNGYNKTSVATPGKYSYSDSEIESFLCKIATLNPNCAYKNINSIFLRMSSSSTMSLNYINSENVLNILDRSIKKSLNIKSMKDIDEDDIIDLLVESIDYLNISFTDEKSLVEKYELAKVIKDTLEEILDEYEISTNKNINNGNFVGF